MNDDSLGSLLHDGTYRARWLREVLKTAQVTDSVRVYLLTLGMHMEPSGRVSVPREDLAGLLGRNPRKVGDKAKAALESGFLEQTARGQKHQTAVYQAITPGFLSMTPGGPTEERSTRDLRDPPGGPPEDSQGAGFKHPERNSQGAGFKHPETQEADLSMPPGGPTEDSQVAPRGAPQYLRGVEVGEEVDLSTSGRLLKLNPHVPPPAGAVAPSADPAEPVTAQTLIAEWIDSVPHTPPGDVIGQLGKKIKTMLGESIPPDAIREGIRIWQAKGLHPSTLPSVVNQVMNAGPARDAPPVDRRQQATNDMFARAAARAAVREEHPHDPARSRDVVPIRPGVLPPAAHG